VVCTVTLNLHPLFVFLPSLFLLLLLLLLFSHLLSLLCSSLVVEPVIDNDDTLWTKFFTLCFLYRSGIKLEKRFKDAHDGTDIDFLDDSVQFDNIIQLLKGNREDLPPSKLPKIIELDQKGFLPFSQTPKISKQAQSPSQRPSFTSSSSSNSSFQCLTASQNQIHSNNDDHSRDFDKDDDYDDEYLPSKNSKRGRKRKSNSSSSSSSSSASSLSSRRPSNAVVNNPLRAKRPAKLNEYDKKWWNYYDKVIGYHEEHGTCNVPSDEVILDDDGEAVELGKWLSNEKGKMENYLMFSYEKYEALTECMVLGLWTGEEETKSRSNNNLSLSSSSSASSVVTATAIASVTSFSGVPQNEEKDSLPLLTPTPGARQILASLSSMEDLLYPPPPLSSKKKESSSSSSNQRKTESAIPSKTNHLLSSNPSAPYYPGAKPQRKSQQSSSSSSSTRKKSPVVASEMAEPKEQSYFYPRRQEKCVAEDHCQLPKIDSRSPTLFSSEPKKLTRIQEQRESDDDEEEENQNSNDSDDMGIEVMISRKSQKSIKQPCDSMRIDSCVAFRYFHDSQSYLGIGMIITERNSNKLKCFDILKLSPSDVNNFVESEFIATKTSDFNYTVRLQDILLGNIIINKGNPFISFIFSFALLLDAFFLSCFLFFLFSQICCFPRRNKEDIW
jgi:hypothetical protein